MTYKKFTTYLKKELKPFYPLREIEGFQRIIIEQILKTSNVNALANPDTKIPKYFLNQINEVIGALKGYKPIQYIFGNTEFYSIPLNLTNDVLIPRPETEELVDWIIKDTENKPLQVLDIGTGSGCIALAVKKHLPALSVDAADYSTAALQVAAKNARRNKLDVHFFVLDILKDPPISKAYDMIISNPPYVTEGEKEKMQPSVLRYEPAAALFVPDNNPLVYYEAIAKFAGSCLKRGGMLYLEINESFPEAVKSLLKQHHFKDIVIKKDIHGKQRIKKSSSYETAVTF